MATLGHIGNNRGKAFQVHPSGDLVIREGVVHEATIRLNDRHFRIVTRASGIRERLAPFVVVPVSTVVHLPDLDGQRVAISKGQVEAGAVRSKFHAPIIPSPVALSTKNQIFFKSFILKDLGTILAPGAAGMSSVFLVFFS